MRISDWSSDVCSSDLLSRARYEDTGQTISRPLQGERLRGAEPARWVVRKGGLEPPRLAAPAPKAGASTSSATFAISARQRRSAHLTRRVRERRKKLVRAPVGRRALSAGSRFSLGRTSRSEEHTFELQSLMRISYAVFCLKNKKNQ